MRSQRSPKRLKSCGVVSVKVRCRSAVGELEGLVLDMVHLGELGSGNEGIIYLQDLG